MNAKQRRLQARTDWSNWEIVHATNSMNDAQIEERIGSRIFIRLLNRSNSTITVNAYLQGFYAEEIPFQL